MSKNNNKKEHDFGDLLVPSAHVDCVKCGMRVFCKVVIGYDGADLRPFPAMFYVALGCSDEIRCAPNALPSCH